jgi:hypothetical protein
VAWPGAATADPIVYDDVWDVSQGASVTSSSPTIYNSSASNMFGGSSGVELPNTLWSDSYGAGQVHWVEWQTADPVTVRRFNLVASHEDPYTRRSFDHFSLYAWSDGGWVQLYDNAVPIPYGGGPTYTGLTYLELNEGVANVVSAQQFRAEFTQYGNVYAARGPRILELDGSLVPEPSTLSLALATLGVLGATFYGRRRKR